MLEEEGLNLDQTEPDSSANSQAKKKKRKLNAFF